MSCRGKQFATRPKPDEDEEDGPSATTQFNRSFIRRNEIISPVFAEELLRKGARWRECIPLHIAHGDVEYVQAGAPPTKQVCADIMLVHKGRVFRAQDVWFYVYEGALPDVMLSEAFLNDIPCVTHPGQKLIDTREREGDIELLAQCMKDYRDLVVRRYTHPECATSNLHMAHINTVLEHVHAGRTGEAVMATDAKQAPEKSL